MSERQQLALIKQMERSTGGSLNDGLQQTSPSRTPLQVVNNANSINSPVPANQIGTPVQGSSPLSISPGTAESSPKTPLEDRIQRRLYRRNGKGETQLHRGAIKGNLMQCKKLLHLGIDPNVTDNAGYTPLHEACNRGNEAIVRLLLRNGADVNVLGGVGEQRESPLHDAARNGHIAVVKLLVSNGANLGAKRESTGQTPLDEAKNSRTKNPHLHEVIQYLTERQENSNPQVDQPELTQSDSESNCEEIDIIKDFTPLDSLPLTEESIPEIEPRNSPSRSVVLNMDEKPPNHEVNTATSSTSNANAPEVPSSTVPASSASISTTPKTEDVYEFKGGNSKDIGTGSNPESSTALEPKKENPTNGNNTGGSSNVSPPVKDESKSKLEKRGAEVPFDEEEEAKKKKQRKDEGSNASVSKGGSRGTRGNSAEKSTAMKPGGKGRLLNADRKSPNSFPNSAANSPKKNNEQSDSDDDNNSKKSTDSSGLKVPPLKIVLSGSNGNNSGNNSSGNSPGSSAQALAQEQADQKSRGICNKPYVIREEEDSSKGDDKSNEGIQGGGSSKGGKDEEGNGKGTGSRMTRSRANQGTPGPDSNDVQGNSSESSSTSAQETGGAQSTSEYHVRKRKLRSQVEENANSHQAGSSTSGNSKSNEPLNDIEKYLNIRKAIEQRRKNCFPVQPKPPQGYEDYLMNRKTYLLQGNANARLASMPKLKPPPSLKGELAELFKKQEEERYKLRCQHIVEKEKLVLNVEYEILRTHGRAARALANQSHPFSVCTMLKDEEIYNTIDPRQDEEKRDIRSRYNGRLFLSWCQDVDDKWEKIKEQVVLRHHNEAESLNAVQKCDWHDKV